MFDISLLQKHIEETGIKQKAIALKAEIPESTLSLILTGKRKCEVNEYVAICKALNVPFTEFINGSKAS